MSNSTPQVEMRSSTTDITAERRVTTAQFRDLNKKICDVTRRLRMAQAAKDSAESILATLEEIEEEVLVEQEVYVKELQERVSEGSLQMAVLRRQLAASEKELKPKSAKARADRKNFYLRQREEAVLGNAVAAEIKAKAEKDELIQRWRRLQEETRNMIIEIVEDNSYNDLFVVQP